MKKPCFQEEQKVRVLKDFTARDEMELSVRADEILVVLGQIRHLFTAFQRKMLGHSGKILGFFSRKVIDSSDLAFAVESTSGKNDLKK